MGRTHTFRLLHSFLLVGLVRSLNCTVDPLVAPYGNVTLRSGVQSFGIPMTLGGQNFALKPTSDQAISYIFSVPRDCADVEDPLACAKDPNEGQVDEVSIGGIFDTKTSGTYEGPLRWANIGGGQQETTQREQRHYGYETIKFGDTLINKFLFLSSDKTLAGDFNYLGLEKNSSLLNALYDLGRIPSKVWGFWGGWTGVTKETMQEGSLVLGGYDDAKVSGSFASYKMINDERRCNLRLYVKDIKVRMLNGVETSVFTEGMTMEACVSPTFNSLSLPRSMVDKIAEAGEFTIDDANRSLGIYVWGFTVPASKKS
ncbi:hypothetical protein ABW19_dt0201955 [Dactylella cylindrospora]|nr:hypothetical protein ABW19_dt0201955 [Dactylella cylindrospora]